MKKRIFQGLIILIVLLLIIILVYSLSRNFTIIQASKAMEPTIKEGQLVKIERPYFLKIKQGDIVLYQTERLKTPLLTRVVSVDYQNKTFTGKEDVYSESGNWERNISLKSIKGRVIE